MGNRLRTATFLKADGLTSQGGQLTREIGEGRCQLGSALTLADSSATSQLPNTSSHDYSVWGGEDRGGGAAVLSGELAAQQEVPAHLL